MDVYGYNGSGSVSSEEHMKSLFTLIKLKIFIKALYLCILAYMSFWKDYWTYK